MYNTPYFSQRILDVEHLRIIIDKNKNRCYNIDTVKEGAKEMDAFLKFDDLDDNRTDTYQILTRIVHLIWKKPIDSDSLICI